MPITLEDKPEIQAEDQPKDQKDSKVNSSRLPFLPSNVNKYYFTKHMIASEDELLAIKKWFKQNPNEHFCPTLKVGDKSFFDIIRSNTNHYYTLYNVNIPSENEGAFGQVVTAYDLEEKRLVAIKLHDSTIFRKLAENQAKKDSKGYENTLQRHLADSDSFHEERVEIETKALNAALPAPTANSFSLFFKNPNSSNENEKKYVTVMPLEEGQNLLTIINNSNSKHYTPGRWIQFAINICKSIQKLHDSNIMHRDIKLGNLMMNCTTGKVSPIDFGFAVTDISEGYQHVETINSKTATGTAEYHAPEIKSGIPSGKVFYNRATDTYAVGLVLAQLFKLKKINSAKLERDTKEAQKLFPDLIVRKKLFDITKKMLQTEQNRSTLSQTIENLKDLLTLCPDMSSNLKKTALLDLEEYKNAPSSRKRSNMISALLNGQFDEIQLIDTEKKLSSDEYAVFRQDLENEGLPVGDVVHHGNAKAIFDYLPQSPDKDQIVRSYFLVSNNSELRQAADKSRVLPVSAANLLAGESSIKESIKKHLETQMLSAYQITYATSHLEKERKRLMDKYFLGSDKTIPCKDKKVTDRVKAINDVIDKLNDYSINTYGGLSSALTALEGEMKTIGFSFDKRSDGARRIEMIKNNILVCDRPKSRC